MINRKIRDVEESITRSLESSARLLSEVGSSSMHSGGLRGLRLDRGRASSRPAFGGEAEYDDEYGEGEEEEEEYYEEDFEPVPNGEAENIVQANPYAPAEALHLQEPLGVQPALLAQ